MLRWKACRLKHRLHVHLTVSSVCCHYEKPRQELPQRCIVQHLHGRRQHHDVAWCDCRNRGYAALLAPCYITPPLYPLVVDISIYIYPQGKVDKKHCIRTLFLQPVHHSVAVPPLAGICLCNQCSSSCCTNEEHQKLQVFSSLLHIGQKVCNAWPCHQPAVEL